jgi:putative ABC transport system permease protein
VALVSRAAAERYWPGRNPIGHRIGDLANEPPRYREKGEWLTIIGVVEDVRHASLIEEPGPAIYVSALQRPARAANVVAAVRTSVAPATLVAPIRERLRTVDSNVPTEFSTMSERVADSVAERRFAMLLLALFAAIALLLAAVGIYGVVAYSVEQRTREMGIRTALGAPGGAVVRTVLAGSLRTVAAGLAVGLLGALALTRLLRGLLYGVSPIDPVIFSAVAALLALVAVVATLIPARRATRVDPMVALRNE